MSLTNVLHTDAPPATVLIRVMVGAVFVSEGIQKFMYPDALGPGRFGGMGFPAPAFWATLVGGTEIVAGLMVTLGLLTRVATLALAAIMLVAIVTTKVPILLGHDIGPFRVRSLDTYGFWSMAHEARTDWSMLLGSVFLMIVGAGPWSLDARSRPVTASRSCTGPAENRTGPMPRTRLKRSGPRSRTVWSGARPAPRPPEGS